MPRIFLVLILSLFANISSAGLDEINSSICRIQNATHIRGTGTIIKKNKDALYILTAGHVVSENRPYFVQFFGQTYPSKVMRTSLINKIYEVGTINDLAVLKVELKDWDKDYIIPPPIKIRNNPGLKTIYTYGCPEGGWPTGVKGYFKGENLGGPVFSPPPLKGRSGSGLFFEAGNETYLEGVIILTDGTSVPTWKIKEKLKEWGVNY